jgi:hypothetical protein
LVPFDVLYAPIIGDDRPDDMNCLKRLDDGNRTTEFIFGINLQLKHREEELQNKKVLPETICCDRERWALRDSMNLPNEDALHNPVWCMVW